MLLPARAILVLAAGLGVGTADHDVCADTTGILDGRFHSFWHDGGSGCMTLRDDGGYAVQWRLGDRNNLVAGRGWATGTRDRVVRYRARTFDPGTNGYLALYGWSTAPLVEYYVVEDWGGFRPPGPAATPLGTLRSDGGTYRIYRTRRVRQPSIAGIATFDQYWSVRTVRRSRGTAARISFANHVAGWRRVGLRLGTPGYQILATEGYGSEGRSDIVMDDLRNDVRSAPHHRQDTGFAVGAGRQGGPIEAASRRTREAVPR